MGGLYVFVYFFRSLLTDPGGNSSFKAPEFKLLILD